MIDTPRLRIRPWWDDDFAHMAEIHADPEMMELLGGPMDRAASDAWIARQIVHYGREGFCFWAVEACGGVAPLIGAVGLMRLQDGMPLAGGIQAGWRIGRKFWGNGYATEAARAALAEGFDHIGASEIVAFTVPHNQPSRAVMEKLGMRHDPADDFDHPRIPLTSPLNRHVLYRLTAPGA